MRLRTRILLRRVVYLVALVGILQIIILIFMEDKENKNKTQNTKLPRSHLDSEERVKMKDSYDASAQTTVFNPGKGMGAPMVLMKKTFQSRYGELSDHNISWLNKPNLHLPLPSEVNKNSNVVHQKIVEEPILSYDPIVVLPIKDRLSLALEPSSTDIAIPKIIHQLWWSSGDDTSAQTPMVFVHWIRGWLKNHPDWQYWFWTEEDMRLLMDFVAPDFVKEFNSFKEDVHRTNIMRYFIIFYFGGVYADLDMESVQSLDSWIKDKKCILPLETEAHAYVLNKRNSLNVMISLLICRAKHPYFKKLIEYLPSYKTLSSHNKLFYADDIYRQYTKDGKSDITLGEPKYFMPMFDVTKIMLIKQICLQNDLTAKQDKVCTDLDAREYMPPTLSSAYTVHHWTHVVENSEYFKYGQHVKISEICPNFINITQIINNGSFVVNHSRYHSIT